MHHDEAKPKHEGINVKKLREMLGVKQETLASDLNVSQQRLSAIEQKDVLDDELKEMIAKALKVPVEAITNLSDETVNNFINSFYENSSFNYHCNINPLGKVMELADENKKLYERLLESEKEKVTLLKKIVDDRNN